MSWVYKEKCCYNDVMRLDDEMCVVNFNFIGALRYIVLPI